MPLRPEQEKLLKDFADNRKHWPAHELDAAIWRIRWALQALPQAATPERIERGWQLLRARVLKDFAELFPERFSNKTNGVTPRRWIVGCNSAPW